MEASQKGLVQIEETRNNIFDEICQVSNSLQANTNNAVSTIKSDSARSTARPSHGKSLSLGLGLGLGLAKVWV